MENILCCPECTFPYDIDLNTPYLLPCGHTVCQSCLQDKLDNQGRVTCCNCQRAYKFRSNDISTFAINQYILAALGDILYPLDVKDENRRQIEASGKPSEADYRSKKRLLLKTERTRARIVARFNRVYDELRDKIERRDETGRWHLNAELRMLGKFCLYMY